MALLRTLTVTAATGLCLLGTVPAAHADTGSGALVRASRGTPWKHHVHAPRTLTAPVATVTSPTSVTPPAVTVVDPAVAFASQIASLVNVERAKVGLPALKLSTCAGRFATTWSQHMAASGDFSHQSLSPIMSDCDAWGAGENIAYGASTPEQFMSMWMNSPGHKANILRASFTHIGVAVARTSSGTWYATQDFLTL